MRYNKSDIDKMFSFIAGQYGYQPLNSTFYGQDGILYFKCFRCKTWCLVDTPEQKNGSTCCEICRRVITKFSRWGFDCHGCLYRPVDIDDKPCINCIGGRYYSGVYSERTYSRYNQTEG